MGPANAKFSVHLTCRLVTVIQSVCEGDDFRLFHHVLLSLLSCFALSVGIRDRHCRRRHVEFIALGSLSNLVRLLCFVSLPDNDCSACLLLLYVLGFVFFGVHVICYYYLHIHRPLYM